MKVGHSRIDRANHAGLAMLSLRAVEPYWLCVFDVDGVGQDVGCSTERSVGGHEAGEECVGLVRHDVLDGHARLVECRLNDGVVLHVSLTSNIL